MRHPARRHDRGPTVRFERQHNEESGQKRGRHRVLSSIFDDQIQAIALLIIGLLAAMLFLWLDWQSHRR